MTDKHSTVSRNHPKLKKYSNTNIMRQNFHTVIHIGSVVECSPVTKGKIYRKIKNKLLIKTALFVRWYTEMLCLSHERERSSKLTHLLWQKSKHMVRAQLCSAFWCATNEPTTNSTISK